MEGLAAIWSDVDRLLNKPTLRKPINTHLCINCNGVKYSQKKGCPFVHNVDTCKSIM